MRRQSYRSGTARRHGTHWCDDAPDRRGSGRRCADRGRPVRLAAVPLGGCPLVPCPSRVVRSCRSARGRTPFRCTGDPSRHGFIGVIGRHQGHVPTHVNTGDPERRRQRPAPGPPRPRRDHAWPGTPSPRPGATPPAEPSGSNAPRDRGRSSTGPGHSAARPLGPRDPDGTHKPECVPSVNLQAVPQVTANLSNTRRAGARAYASRPPDSTFRHIRVVLMG